MSASIRATVGALLLAAHAPLAGAATFTVNTIADVPNVTGTACNVPNANTCSLRAAIEQANTAAGADTIDFAAGVAGQTTTLLSSYPNITGPVTITGPATGFTVDGDTSYSLLRFTAAAATSSVSNLTLTGGLTAANGGGVYNAGTLTLTNVTVTANSAGMGFGGGIYTQGVLAVSDSTISDNAAGAGGGIFSFSNGTDLLTSTLTVYDTTISGNTATGVGGGGIYARVDEGSHSFGNVVIENNAATNAAGVGGGIYAYKSLASADFFILASTIRGNTATDFGGGIYAQRGRIVINSTTLSGNAATTAGSGQGGGIYLDVEDGNAGASVQLGNATLSGNSAWVGGAIGIAAANTSKSSMINTTLALNTATEPNGGGGIAYGTPSDSGLSLATVFPGEFNNPFTANLFAGNTGGSCRTTLTHADPDNSGYNHASDTSCGFGQATDVQHVDVGLIRPLAANGWLHATHALKKGNPAIDHANAAHATANDGRGAPVANGDESPDALTERDAGAYEFGGYGAIEFTTTAFSKDEDTTPAAITIRRFGNTDTAPQVSFTTANGAVDPATAPADYTDSDQTVSFAATETLKTVNVPIVDDRSDTPEANETVALALANATLGADLTGQNNDAATLTIVEIEEGKLQLSAATYSFDENVAGNVATITVKRVTGNGKRAVSVAYATSDGTGPNAAVAGTDYTAASGRVSWADGDVADKTFTVPLIDNQVAEGNKTFNVTISSPNGNAILGTPVTAVVTITDTDPPQTGSLELEFVSYAVAETAGSPFKVKRVGGSQNAITVECVPVNGTATLGTDFTNPTQTLAWADGDTADKTCDIDLTNDATRESDKAFQVKLQNPQNTTTPETPPTLTVGKDQAAVALTSDERPRYAFDATSYSVLETATTLTVTIEAVDGAPLGQTVTIPVTITNGTATSGTDYSPATVADRTWTQNDGASKTITFTIVNDGTVEGNETFTVQLGAPIGGAETAGTNPVTVTIVDPAAVRFKASDFSGGETNGSAIRVTVERVGNPSGTASVEYTVGGGTATADVDYTPPPGTPMRILSWGNNDVADKFFDITVIGDTADEADETINLALTNPSAGLTIGTPSTATATITDDDDAPSVTLGLTGSPLAEDGGVATVTATLSAASGKTVTVNLGFTGTAASPDDYAASAASIVIAAGQTTGSITLTGADDLLDEAGETIVVDIASVTNGTESGTQQVTATITDDDVIPDVTLSLADSPMAENGGVATVTATLSAASGQDVTIDLGFSGGAVAPNDYVPSASSMVIAAGDTTGSITLTAADDAVDEANETVVVDVTNVTNGTESGTQQVTATIVDDDAGPTVTLAVLNSPFTEGGTATIRATLSATSGQAVTVALGFTGTAVSPGDFSATATSIVINPGLTSGQITLTAADDALDEPDETIVVDITGVTNGTESGTQQVTATITDNDAAPTVTLAVTGTPVAEAAGVATFTATLSAASGQAVTVTLGFTGTAANPGDYTRSGTSITIPAGSLSGFVTATAVQDTADEPDETVIVDITAVTNATESGTQQRTATIVDDDATPPPPSDDGGSWSWLSLWLLFPAWLRRRGALAR